ncbi:MAG TPA: hypothetical protein VFV67_29450 [Actinophytocola sp.]|uniref:hypothetical protein n=1 Tax=Actinophytocola sp. TaxID=1872138 RepID=UPI002DB5D537|nr:hypothetical protein [Actinophytocola sp.]HEU5474789.1 hypothetical protein [Actinophytocola sp.]
MDGNSDSSRLNISLSKQTFWFSGQVKGWSMGDIGACRLFDNFQFTPPTGLSPLELSAATTVVHCVWAKKGNFWLDSVLKVGGSYSSRTGASGSLTLPTGLHYAPIPQIDFVFGITINGTVDKNGANISAHFHDSGFVLTAPKSLWTAQLGVYF